MAKFDENWKEVFEGAEVTPSDSVWVNIDRDLANTEGEVMRTRVVFYQRIAAASLLFALLVGSFGVYRWKENTDQLAQNKALKDELRSLTDQKQIAGEEEKEPNVAPSFDRRNLSTADQKNEAGKSISSPGANGRAAFKSLTQPRQVNPAKISETNGVLGNFGQPLSQFAGKNKDDKKVNPAVTEQRFFEISLGDVDPPGTLPVPEIKDGPVMTEVFRKLPAISGAFMERKERKPMHEHVWASVTASAGTYNPNAYSNYNYGAASQVSSSGAGAPVGSSYSFGMLAGVRVANRVVLQSGVQYMNQAVGSTSNIDIAGSSLVGLAQYASSPTTVSNGTTAPYGVNSSNELVSVPFQAGYLLIDQKIGWQLNSGVSSDFFVRNTLSDPSGQRQSYSQGAGSASPYRSVNFSGLMSSEVSYRLGSHYRVSLVPGFRYSFNPILKSATGTGNPWVWDVGFRFRYIFK